MFIKQINQALTPKICPQTEGCNNQECNNATLGYKTLQVNGCFDVGRKYLTMR